MSEAALSYDAIRSHIDDVIGSRHFVASGPLSQLECEHQPSETIAWELFRGQLVPAHLTRQQRIFSSWNIFGEDETGRSGEPLLSVKLDRERSELHVVRGLLCYVWEGYDSGGNVYLSREVQRWTQELVGTLSLRTTQTQDLSGELSRLLYHAVVGTSRLPLTSVQTPLPAWSLGRLGYFHDGLASSLAIAELAPRVLEWLIRSVSPGELAGTVKSYIAQWRGLGKSSQDTMRLFRAMFNEVSLSPYTDFVDKTLEFLRQLVSARHLAIGQQIDFLGWLLRQLARHLTAYDLVTFHHRGANYPDALLLDTALKEYLRLLEAHPALFNGDGKAARLRRRALRAGWLHRRRYEDHPVPDAPTSPGENMRVLPPPHVRVPEEQILNYGKRKKRLYAADPLSNHVGEHSRAIMQQSGRDLRQETELSELGMAIFVDRPLPDPSPLLAHEGFSRSLAERALKELARDPIPGLSAEDTSQCLALLAQAPIPRGIAATSFAADPGRVVSLADTTKASPDFVILRTLPASVRAFCRRPEVAEIVRAKGINLDAGEHWLIVANVTADLPVVFSTAKATCYLALL
ncbi:MAG TPA: hypothetical protein VE988_24915 [Gemmataceae bacterium]|nr:hypothetical protein [Gemmataceae bacterium]